MTTLVSVNSSGTQANQLCAFPSISGDGRYVLFESEATNLTASDNNGARDVFVRDRQVGITYRVGIEGNLGATFGALSANGSAVVYQSGSSNLVTADNNSVIDIFLFENRP